jgi:hypothetical protein
MASHKLAENVSMEEASTGNCSFASARNTNTEAASKADMHINARTHL